MKCPFCDTEIEEGSLFCNHCGNAIQVVPDYNLLEDEVLPELLSDKNKEPVKKEQKKEQKKRSTNISAVGFFASTALVFAIILAVFFSMRYYNSPSYFLKKGNDAFYSQEYGKAISYYTRVLDETGDDIQVLLSLGNAQNAAGYFEEAKNTYGHVLLLDETNLEAFQALVLMLNNNNDSAEIDTLSAIVKTKEQQEFLDTYRIAPPSFSVPGGAYADDVTVEMSCDEGDAIYYTTDGTAPSEHNGTLYEEGVHLSKQGTTILSAVSKDQNTGKLSAVISETYEISYEAPSTPTLSPSGGKMTQETFITITPANETDRIYYTWDDTVPTVNSARYTGPILVPEGNNILTVIAVSTHDMSSDVLKANYIYLP
ncbi:MAG: chitobiase/beta-hexosaminidase C-terminal domain-containing protein [Lachnospiraceae bacterium]|nr:chitobiase/beta-hexosaminidase C-terminal domain-containing protein [Lachnospiraceae bacterium]